MDDEPSILGLAAAFLAQVGCQAAVAANSQAAVTAYAKALADGQPFDLVILDLTLPGEPGGIDTLRTLKALDPAVRAVVSSGYSQDPVMADPQAFGFVASLEKPYRFAQLRGLLQRIFG